MSEAFRKCARAFLEGVGIKDPSDNYLTDLDDLNQACGAWMRGPGRQFETMELRLPTLDPETFVTGNLDAADSAGYCANEAARDFVRYIDDVTGHKCTLFQLQVCVMLQLARLDQKVNTEGGQC